MRTESDILISGVRELRAQFLSVRDLAALEPQWRALASNAAETNPFFSPDLFLPVLDLAPSSMRIAAAFDGAGALGGLVPLVPARGYARLPIAFVQTWLHPHCFFGAPLIRHESEESFFAALYPLADKFRSAAFLRLNLLDADAQLIEAAEAAARRQRRFVTRWRSFERAMLKTALPPEQYLDAMRAKKRKELRRQKKRLEEEGALSFRRLDEAAELSAWTEAFLKLEGAGWKGAAGTALNCNAVSAALFRDAVARAFAAGSLRFFRLDLDEKPVAMIVNFVERGCGYSFKIAHDEALARFSPGVLLEIEMMRALEAEKIEFFDSCASEGHPMIESLWRERRRLTSLHVSLNGAAGAAQLRAGALLERLAERIKRPKNSDRAEDQDAGL